MENKVTEINPDFGVVIDLETVGKEAGCGILSIGATTLNGEYTFSVGININTCYAAGLWIDPTTMNWWSTQTIEAREAAFSGTCSIETALDLFADWYKSVGSPLIWGNGAGFDFPILGAAYGAIGAEIPWKYHDERCYRTLKALYPEIPADKFQGIKHVALCDAMYEAQHLRKILVTIKEGKIKCT